MPEQIIHMLQEAGIKLAGGETTGEVCRGEGNQAPATNLWAPPCCIQAGLPNLFAPGLRIA